MENMKLPPFYVGQKVVYITGNYLPKDSTWIVLEMGMEKCGCWAVNIGTIGSWKSQVDNPFNSYFNCKCGKKVDFFDSIFSQKKWILASSFRAIEERPSYMTFEQIKEKEKEQVLINN